MSTSKLGSARNGSQIGYKQALAIINNTKALPLLAKDRQSTLCVRAQALADAWAQDRLGFTECVPEAMQRQCIEALVKLYRTSVREAQRSIKQAGAR